MKKSTLLAVLTVIIWASLATAAKILLKSIPDLEALAVSGFFAFLFLLGVNLVSGRLHRMKEYSPIDFMKMAGLGFIGLFLYSALYYYGIDQLSAQTACIVNYLWPIMLVAFSCLILKEKMTVLKAAALLVSFAGVVVLTAGGPGSGNGNFGLGVAACVTAAACYGLFCVLNKKADMDQNITMMVVWLTVAVCSFALGMTQENWVTIHGSQWLGLIWLGVVADAIAYLTWALALKGEGDSAVISNIAYLTPLLSVIISAVVLGERLTIHAFVAFIFIIAGIALQAVDSMRRSRA